MPDVSLQSVNAENYSAIAFIGGWGASMYQYTAFTGDYQDDHYDGDLATKTIVNDLINDFLADDKHVAAICHATTILAWARLADGTSPVNGRQVSIPDVGSPAVWYEGIMYANGVLGQYDQVVANGGLANAVSGQYGDPTTALDDVVVDGNIITAENWDSAAMFGQVLAAEIFAATGDDTPTPGVEYYEVDAFAPNPPSQPLVVVGSGDLVLPSDTRESPQPRMLPAVQAEHKQRAFGQSVVSAEQPEEAAIRLVIVFNTAEPADFDSMVCDCHWEIPSAGPQNDATADAVATPETSGGRETTPEDNQNGPTHLVGMEREGPTAPDQLATRVQRSEQFLSVFDREAICERLFSAYGRL